MPPFNSLGPWIDELVSIACVLFPIGIILVIGYYLLGPR